MVKVTVEMDGKERVIEGEFVFAIATAKKADRDTSASVILSGSTSVEAFVSCLVDVIPTTIEKINPGDRTGCLDSMILLNRKLKQSIKEYSKEHFDEIAQEIKRLLEEDPDAVMQLHKRRAV